MSWYFAYVSPLAEGTQSATIVESRPSRLSLTGPADPPAEIGAYVAELGDEPVARLRGIVKASDYTNQPASGPVPPETALLSMGEGQNNDPPNPFRGFVFHQVPPAIRPVIDEMTRNIAELRKHPHHVVRGEARWAKPSFATRDDLQARVRFLNPGSDPAELYHPAGATDGAHVTTTVVVSRDVAAGTLRETDIQSVNLDPSALTALDAQGQPAAAPQTVVIPPAASIEFDVRLKNVFLSPGTYTGRVIFRLVRGDIDFAQAVYGTLAVPIGSFAVA